MTAVATAFIHFQLIGLVLKQTALEEGFFLFVFYTKSFERKKKEPSSHCAQQDLYLKKGVNFYSYITRNLFH